MRASATLELRHPAVTDTRSIVYVVDDDASVRESLCTLFEEWGYRSEVYSSAEEFLAYSRQPAPGCLILDVGLPVLNGLELQRLIGNGQSGLPIIFITGNGDIPMSVQAMKGGAIEFLTKPFRPEALLAAVSSATERSRLYLAEQVELNALRKRHESLSRREQEVMSLVIRGQLNKQVAATLGISEITVKAHRGRAMRKMKAKSLADLVIIGGRLGRVSPNKE
jgi:FixJ family two-component response regulator